MNFENIEKLAEILDKYNLSEIDYTESDAFSITLKGAVAAPVQAMAAPVAQAASAAAPVVNSDEGLHIVTSELVGTFYASASPDSAAYIKVGDEVTVDSTLCIVEAMKVMNEIKSEVNGTVVEILVDNGTPVEYGQAIIKIKPS
ncbi:acetyl-CoA carboxylase biotin carboxyl carrier protein [Lentisphaera profundi]|uniref:Biotin carboxyl carrier protein of acetyl-CoA carboxylase n=1 Tax=Lentisphaera profundi TaxID=1658616 RepID=A0ABY7VQI9_9BACT|nr:acetyl-CoA carboxylase biotin carboxyl carrier protein [Lentisphaera profundi]WDE96272.1 acetyl-CoA carboxylase biotin carboxyl carrier protein [Lentisphaera profundi]